MSPTHLPEHRLTVRKNHDHFGQQSPTVTVMSTSASDPLASATSAAELVLAPSPDVGRTPNAVPQPAESAARLRAPRQLEGEMLDTEILAEIAGGLAASVGPPHPVGEGAIERVRVLATEGYDAWVMIWGPGAEIAEHDHDGSLGVLHVIDGELAEVVVDGDIEHRRRLPVGETTEFAATHRHALENPSMVTARSVNVYSPPLGSAIVD